MAHPRAQLKQDSCQKTNGLIVFYKNSPSSLPMARLVKNPDSANSKGLARREAITFEAAARREVSRPVLLLRA